MPQANRLDNKPFWLVYFLNFLWAFAFALPLYVQSSFLESVVGIERVGLVIAIGSITTLVAMMLYPKLLSRLHNYKVALLAAGMYFVGVLLLIVFSGVVSLIGYVTLTTVLSLYTINLDLFLERISDDRLTGRIRTLKLTFTNIAILISPIIMGYLLGDTANYKLVYLISGVVFFPVVILLLYKRAAIEDKAVEYRQRSFAVIGKLLQRHPNLFRILCSEFALRFFYGIMVLYVPIYLHEYVGFDWPTMGIIFTTMLLPFVLLQIPAGQLADKYIGEKEMIVGGIVVAMLFTLTIVFLDTSSVLIWIIVLFMTRVGAALMEAMNEVYFFKHVDTKDADLIDVFRDIRPFGWLAAAFSSYVLLQIYPHIQYVFILLMCVLLVALWPVGRLKDTK